MSKLIWERRAKQQLQKFAQTPAKELLHDFIADTTKAMLVWELGVGGASTVIKAMPPVAKFTTNTAKNAAKITREFIATHDFQSPLVFDVKAFNAALAGKDFRTTLYGLGGAVYDSAVILSKVIKFKKPLYQTQVEFLATKVGAIAGEEHQMIISQGVNGYQNFSMARAQAKEFVLLGDDAVPMLSNLGPHNTNVFVGMRSRDGKSFWALRLG